MRRDHFFHAVLGVAVLCGGCKQVATTAATVTKVSVCETCEDKALDDLKVNLPSKLPNLNLKPGEITSLTNVMPVKTAVGVKATHLHADVVNGELVFHADDEPAHVGSSQLGMVVQKSDGSAPIPVRVVATPEAASLLHKRAG